MRNNLYFHSRNRIEHLIREVKMNENTPASFIGQVKKYFGQQQMGINKAKRGQYGR